ncbi:MAG: endopeptidase La [Candidatus Rokuibacteriota bacterium]|nr:MAG: endopeptidase La [Candidatus Rokubacteria bacterium]
MSEHIIPIGTQAAAPAPTAPRAEPTEPDELAILPLREAVLFPQAVVPLAVARPASVRLVDEAVLGARVIGVVTQREGNQEDPAAHDLHAFGTVAVIHRMLKQPDGTIRLVIQGVERFRIVEFTQATPYFKARIERIGDIVPGPDDVEGQALARQTLSLFQRIVELSPMLSDDLLALVGPAADAGRIADLVAAVLPSLSTEQKQTLLATPDVKARLKTLVEGLSKEVEVLELGSKIQSQIQSEMSKSQREYYLREQMKAIQKELGEGDDRGQEIDELRQKIEAAGMSEEARREALRELDRLTKMPPAAAEYTVARTYLEWLVSLPWQKETPDHIDLARARVVLDEDHSGLEKIKDRILEHLAVRKIRPEGKAPILCFVGPPGVGKTSLGRSIARALGRTFHRISLGGMRDEAEIRGHRRTYIGALPGQIVQGLRRAESRNPVFMLDEVDKLGHDFRGDPASALLEVLDPEQNATFRDHYLDVAFNLSRILFITTANLLDPVPAPLRDRMEVIQLSGYTEDEKVEIAKRHLGPKQAAEHGLVLGQTVTLTDAALRLLVRSYTREAGVRGLEREIAAVFRKTARRRAEGDLSPVTVDPARVEALLGAPRFLPEEELAERARAPGVAVGLAWTPTGGEVLFVEASKMPGGKTLTLTGQLGDVMKESAQTAVSWVRAHAQDLGIDPGFWSRCDLHLHVPAGGIPKDGPSAGITLATALVSLLTGRPVRARLAMTGEITLSGRVLPVGGIKEKVLAAHRAGIQTLILPRQAEQALRDDVPLDIRSAMSIHLVSTVAEVLHLALGHESLAPGSEPELEAVLAGSP